MSTFDSPPQDGGCSPPVDPALLDRLVDGELADAERRQLLERLECTPGAWRQCAMAFLEAQCWKEALGQWNLPPAEGVPAAAARPLAAPVRRLGRWEMLAALAASMLIAGVFGGIVGSAWRPGAVLAPLPLAGAPAAIVPPAAPREAGPNVVEAAQWTTPSVSPPATPDARAEVGQPGWETITVRVPDPSGMGTREIPLPVFAAQGIDPSWLEPAPLPPEMCECLRRQGYEVRHHRALVPAPCGDGRCLVMPVDQVEIHYVGNGKFQ